MKVDLSQHMLEGVRYISSPNSNDRPEQADIELIVIHCISLPPGHYGGPEIEQLFSNRLAAEQRAAMGIAADLRVSAHLLIRRDAQLIQFVPFDRRAWHAGVSSYKGHKNCNDFSIGIELEGCVTKPYEAQQYAVLRAVVAALIAAYPTLPQDCISYHSDIAPGRKRDPGPYFDRNFMHSAES